MPDISVDTNKLTSANEDIARLGSEIAAVRDLFRGVREQLPMGMGDDKAGQEAERQIGASLDSLIEGLDSAMEALDGLVGKTVRGARDLTAAEEKGIQTAKDVRAGSERGADAAVEPLRR